MRHLFNPSHIAAGFSTVLVGYASAVVIVIQAATAMGGTPTQIESWLFSVGIAMGVTCIGFSWYYKKPVLTAWSTPGAVILASMVGQFDMSTAIGAFIISGALFVLTGVVRPFSKALESIPSSLGAAMLCAILLPFCVGAFEPITDKPWLFAAMFTTYMVSKQFVPKYTMLLLLVVGGIGSYWLVDEAPSITLSLAQPEWMPPNFDLQAMINLALPLYLVTMLSQNLPGVAMLRSHNYHVPVRPLLIGTGVTNVLLAPFGTFALNLAAITAAICMNPSVDDDPDQRYRAALWAGVFYLIAGLLASTVVALFTAFPIVVIKIITGFALLGTLMMCLQTAFSEDKTRESALFTFLITLSGASLFGLGSTILGLFFGLVYLHFIGQKKAK